MGPGFRGGDGFSMTPGQLEVSWNPALYATHAAFVPALGAPVLALLNAKAGERILDLGCGDGVLTAQLVVAGASVLGVDADPAMVAAAVAKGLDVHVGDGRSLRLRRRVRRGVHQRRAALDGRPRAGHRRRVLRAQARRALRRRVRRLRQHRRNPGRRPRGARRRTVTAYRRSRRIITRRRTPSGRCSKRRGSASTCAS